MTDPEAQARSQSPGVMKLMCGSVVTLGVAVTAGVTSIYSSDIAVGISAWVATAVIGASAMIAAFRQS